MAESFQMVFERLKAIMQPYESRLLVKADEAGNYSLNTPYSEKFKKEIVGQKIKIVERRGKNILIHLSGEKTILVHMKMTGHFLYDNSDKFIHLDFTLSNGKHLAFSDVRKFAKVTLG